MKKQTAQIIAQQLKAAEKKERAVEKKFANPRWKDTLRSINTLTARYAEAERTHLNWLWKTRAMQLQRAKKQGKEAEAKRIEKELVMIEQNFSRKEDEHLIGRHFILGTQHIFQEMIPSKKELIRIKEIREQLRKAKQEQKEKKGSEKKVAQYRENEAKTEYLKLLLLITEREIKQRGSQKTEGLKIKKDWIEEELEKQAKKTAEIKRQLLRTLWKT